MNSDIMKSIGMDKYVDDYNRHICPFCNKPVDESKFVSEIEKKEFKISGLCKTCQDNFFKKK